MSTFVIQINKMLNSLITSKTRLRLLVKFFINATNAGYLRGLATEMQENTNAIRKELNNLSEAGYIYELTPMVKLCTKPIPTTLYFQPFKRY